MSEKVPGYIQALDELYELGGHAWDDVHKLREQADDERRAESVRRRLELMDMAHDHGYAKGFRAGMWNASALFVLVVLAFAVPWLVTFLAR